ncbi:MAG TPA: pitrilysin family protein [Opitutaceae bacterium]
MPKSASPAADLRLLEPFWGEPVQRFVLPNGLTLLLKPDRAAAIASVQVWVKTGSIHEGAKLGAGLSHFLEHMLFKGTTRRAGREISATVQAHGGYINAYTTFDRTVYYIDIPSEHTAVAVDILADAVLHSTLPADEVEKEKQVILREIAMGQDDPDHRLGEALFDTAFRLHPYRHPIIGHRDVFGALTRDDLVAYYKTRYVPNNLVVVIAGDIEPAAARAAVEAHFGPEPRRELAPVFIPDEPPPLAPRELHRHDNVELARAGLAWAIPGLTHPDAPALDVLAMILGHGDSSVLWQAVREKARLVHTIDASSWNPGSSGLFYISFTCEGGRREAATAAIERTLAGTAARGFTPAQIRKAVRQLVVSEINTRKTVAGQASRLGVAEVVVGDLHHGRSYFEALGRVTPADLKRLLKTYLVPARCTAVSLNPAVAATQAGAASAAGVSAIPDVTEERLPNGARLLFQPDRRLPNVHIRLACLGGPLFEAPGGRGATALLATLLAKDTRARSAAAVAQTIEEVGGALYPFSGNNSFGLAVEVLPPDVPRGLALLGDAVLAPAFKASTFETERDAQLAELADDADDVVTLGRKLLRKKFFGNHPLAIDAAGDEAGLRALTPKALAALHRQLVVAPNVVLSVTGDFVPSKLAPALKAFLRQLRRGEFVTPVQPHTAPAEAGDFVEAQPRQQAVVYQAFPGPGVLGEDFYVAEVAEELFSGMSSRLFERVREEKGLAYFVRASRVTGLHTGMFYFYAGTAPGRDHEVLGEIDAEIARVAAGGVAPEELLRCQTRLKAARRMGLQTNASRALHAALNALYGQAVNDWKNYDARIDAVTISDLARFAEARLRQNLRTQLAVKP